jgi:hypothetical protein
MCPYPSPPLVASACAQRHGTEWDYAQNCINNSSGFHTHESVHRRRLSINTNKMQLCNRIYYSKVYWRLNMFRVAHRSSSGALNCICSLWFIYCNKVKDSVYIIYSIYYTQSCITYTKSFTLLQYINQRPQKQFRAPDDERRAAWNMLSLQ